MKNISLPGQGNDNHYLQSEVDKSKAKEYCKIYKDVIVSAIAKLEKSPINHLTYKLHNSLKVIKGKQYNENTGSLKVSELIKDKYDTYDEILPQLPPPFFSTELTYKKRGKNDMSEEISLQSMSSGERQMLHGLSYILYHIKNIAESKDENDKRIVSYHHINLIFDEAELYYHPEFQRKFVKGLLENLSYLHINKTIIRSINIIIITHSPFILSDIPQSNVLFLDRENVSKEEMPQTLGANIYDLLKSGFFLDYAIGDVVQKKLRDILDIYYLDDDNSKKKVLFKKNKDEIWYTISHLGEEYLHKKFEVIYHQMEVAFLDKSEWNKRTEDQIKSLEEEILRLKKQLEIYEKN